VSGLIWGPITGDFFNCVARSNGADLIATGDDNGHVRLYRYPIAAEVLDASDSFTGADSCFNMTIRQRFSSLFDFIVWNDWNECL
jgi:hypothetical protein